MKYAEYGKGQPIVLIHGLFGDLSNWTHQIMAFSKTHCVIVPELDFDIPSSEFGLQFLCEELSIVLKKHRADNAVLVGNSLGGHIAVLFAYQFPEVVSKLVLSGSSGLFENTLNGAYPKRSNRAYIQERVEYTFHDPKVVTEELLATTYQTINDNRKCFNIIRMAKEAQRNHVHGILPQIEIPTLLIWGANDKITPPHVAEEFHALLPQSELHWIDKCGHAPMMEHPGQFNKMMKEFLLP